MKLCDFFMRTLELQKFINLLKYQSYSRLIILKMGCQCAKSDQKSDMQLLENQPKMPDKVEEVLKQEVVNLLFNKFSRN